MQGTVSDRSNWTLQAGNAWQQPTGQSPAMPLLERSSPIRNVRLNGMHSLQPDPQLHNTQVPLPVPLPWHRPYVIIVKVALLPLSI